MPRALASLSNLIYQELKALGCSIFWSSPTQMSDVALMTPQSMLKSTMVRRGSVGVLLCLHEEGALLVSVSATTPSGESFDLGDVSPSQTIGQLKRTVARNAGICTGAQQLWLPQDARDDAQQLIDNETVGSVLSYSPICVAQGPTAALELVLAVMIDVEEWESLVSVRDALGYAQWTDYRAGWAKLEEHKNVSRCEGVEVDEYGKISDLCLLDANLQRSGDEDFPSLAGFTILDHISLSDNVIFSNMSTSILGAICREPPPSLHTLDLSSCALLELPSMACLDSLTDLSLSDNSRLPFDCVNSFFQTPPPELQRIDLSNCALHAMPTLTKCMALTSIEFTSNPQLTYHGLAPFCINPPPNLEHLGLCECEIDAVPSMSACAFLTSLDLSANISAMSNSLVSFFENPPPKLTKIDLTSCGLDGLPPMSQCKALLEIDLSDSSELTTIGLGPFFLAPPPQLQILQLYGSGITSLPSLAAFSHLVELTLSESQALTTAGLESFCVEPPPKLKKLELWGCTMIQALPSMAQFASLSQIDLTDCAALAIAGLELFHLTPPPQLESLTLADCDLDGLPPMHACRLLKSLDLSDNRKLDSTNTKVFFGCPPPQLQTLNLNGCNLEGACGVWRLDWAPHIYTTVQCVVQCATFVNAVANVSPPPVWLQPSLACPTGHFSPTSILPTAQL
jgi:Leucine-rich repeat (LRR) protein